MPFSRRAFLQSAGAALGSIALPPVRALAATRAIDLRAVVFRQSIVDGGATELWGFNGSTPGPLLRFAQGDVADVQFRNLLPRATTVHWHGIRLPNAMDGVPHVTQEPIPANGGFRYRFPVDDAGTYWYHPHQSSFEQVPRGLYGVLIVDEPKPVPVDREVVWVLSDFKLDKEHRHVEDFGKVLDFGSGGRLGNTFAVNGKAAGPGTRLELRPNERIRLRLLNAASARLFLLDFTGHDPIVVSHDGQPVEPHPLAERRLMLAPGQRTDLVIDGTASPQGTYAVMDRRDKGYELARIAYSGKPARGKALATPAAMAPNRHAEPDLAKASPHFLVFEGGVLGMPAIAKVDDKALNVQDIMQKHGLSWTMNYTAQHEHAMMHEPLFRFRKGEHVSMRMINNTEFEHPMHMHGHFFKVIAIDGRPVRRPEWRDTVMLWPRGTCDIAFVADNPGEWMFHCHILDHAAGGMMGTMVVEE